MEKTKRLPAIFFIMAKIGLFTFGGGWSIIAQIQNEFVDKKGWMTEEQIVDYMSRPSGCRCRRLWLSRW